jgi:hypothetical protein
MRFVTRGKVEKIFEIETLFRLERHGFWGMNLRPKGGDHQWTPFVLRLAVFLQPGTETFRSVVLGILENQLTRNLLRYELNGCIISELLVAIPQRKRLK